MKKSAIVAAISIFILSIGLACASPGQAVTQIRNNASQVLSILSKANGQNDRRIRQQAENYALPYFDFERMTALALGGPWRTATATQKRALTNEFKTLLIRTYSGTMLKFKNAKVNVLNQPHVFKGGKEIVVHTTVSNAGAQTTRMDYTMYQSGNIYRIYNITVEGASLVTVYRNQFNQTVKQKGINGLINELKAKNGR